MEIKFPINLRERHGLFMSKERELYVELKEIEYSNRGITTLISKAQEYNQKGEIDLANVAKFVMAKMYYDITQYDKAKDILKNIIFKTREVDTNEIYVAAFYLIGRIESIQVNNSIAYFYYREGIKIAKKYRYEEMKYRFQLEIAMEFIYANKYDDAIRGLGNISDEQLKSTEEFRMLLLLKYEYLLLAYLKSKNKAMSTIYYNYINKEFDPYRGEKAERFTINNFYLYFALNEKEVERQEYEKRLVEVIKNMDIHLENISDVYEMLSSLQITKSKYFKESVKVLIEYTKKMKYRVWGKRFYGLKIDYLNDGRHKSEIIDLHWMIKQLDYEILEEKNNWYKEFITSQLSARK